MIRGTCFLCSIVITSYPQFGQCPGRGNARMLRRSSQYVANEEIPHHLTAKRRPTSVVLAYHERGLAWHAGLAYVKIYSAIT